MESCASTTVIGQERHKRAVAITSVSRIKLEIKQENRKYRVSKKREPQYKRVIESGCMMRRSRRIANKEDRLGMYQMEMPTSEYASNKRVGLTSSC